MFGGKQMKRFIHSGLLGIPAAVVYAQKDRQEERRDDCENSAAVMSQRREIVLSFLGAGAAEETCGAAKSASSNNAAVRASSAWASLSEATNRSSKPGGIPHLEKQRRFSNRHFEFVRKLLPSADCRQFDRRRRQIREHEDRCCLGDTTPARRKSVRAERLS